MAIIEVQDLSKRYGSHTAVNEVSFAVEQGEIFGILGPNGAGKTTTVECIEGLRRPDGGTVRVAGFDPQDDTRELRQLLGAQLQQSELPDKLRVGEAMRLYSSFYRAPADWRDLIEALRLSDKLRTQFRSPGASSRPGEPPRPGDLRRHGEHRRRRETPVRQGVEHRTPCRTGDSVAGLGARPSTGARTCLPGTLGE